jgi:peroxiredoxin
VHVAIVCFDPFPSVARFVARQRLRLNVLLDGDHQLRDALPCPSVPYTYVIDRNGRIAVAQAGEVDWWSQQTIEALRSVDREPGNAPSAPPS